jgi:hypothetical protein
MHTSRPEIRRAEHVLGTSHKQHIIMCLKVNVGGISNRGHVLRRPRLRGIPHVDDTEALRKHVADICVTSVHHDLDAVGTTALIAMTNEAHVAGKLGNRKILSSHIAYLSS